MVLGMGLIGGTVGAFIVMPACLNLGVWEFKSQGLEFRV